MLFAVYVDDIITATNSNKKMEKLKKKHEEPNNFKW